MDAVSEPNVEFSSMSSQRHLLSAHDPDAVWCLAEEGRQYVVFSTDGLPFALALAEGRYEHNRWINTKTGLSLTVPAFVTSEAIVRRFDPPEGGDWMLVLR